MSTAGKIKTTLVLRIGYDGLDKVIWRDVAVHKDMPLNKLAYLILPPFQRQTRPQKYPHLRAWSCFR